MKRGRSKNGQICCTNTPGIQIETKKIIVRGVQMRRIVSIKALSEDELPERYMDGYPHVYAPTPGSNDNNYLLRFRKCEGWWSAILAHTYTETEFQGFLSVCREAGERLTLINRGLATENDAWNGRETFVI